MRLGHGDKGKKRQDALSKGLDLLDLAWQQLAEALLQCLVREKSVAHPAACDH